MVDASMAALGFPSRGPAHHSQDLASCLRGFPGSTAILGSVPCPGLLIERADGFVKSRADLSPGQGPEAGEGRGGAHRASGRGLLRLVTVEPGRQMESTKSSPSTKG